VDGAKELENRFVLSERVALLGGKMVICGPCDGSGGSDECGEYPD
jgi:hypothetical protein